MKKYMLVTTKTNSRVGLEGLNIGGDYQLSRPFDWQELQAWVQNLVSRRRRLEETDQHLELRAKSLEVISADEALSARMMKVVEDNMANPDFCIDHFAREMGMSTTGLYRKVMELTGYSPNDFVRQMRLQRAASLLAMRAGNVSEIGYRVGFTSLSYFSKRFKEKFGVLPSAYRNV